MRFCRENLLRQIQTHYFCVLGEGKNFQSQNSSGPETRNFRFLASKMLCGSSSASILYLLEA